ncbi:hypothetical protein [Gloeothece citriformis]|nr:hypothetical protein [Gloeothece citriformis]
MSMIISHKQKPFWYCALPIGLGVMFLGSMSVKPVRAGIADFLDDTIFGDIYSELVSFFPQAIALNQWISLLEDNLNDPCETTPILFATPSEPGWCTTSTDILGEDSMTGILEDVTGELGIPDPIEARSQIQEKVDQAGETDDPFIVNPELYGIELGNISDRSATALSVKTVLSQEGQEQMTEEIEQSSEVVQSILDTSDEAQSYNSTQDVVKALARINAQQSVITAMQHASSLRNRTDAQFTNLNLANISRSLDEQNRDKQAQSTVDGFLLLNLTSQSNLF